MNASDYHDLLLFCSDEGLAAPPLSVALADAVRRTGTRAFGASVQTPAGVDAFHLGCTGHGVNSNVLRYELLYGPLAIVLSRRWGNAYDDSGDAARRIARAFELAAQAMALIDKLADQGRLLGQRLLVVDTENEQAGWNWVAVGQEEHTILKRDDRLIPIRAAVQSLIDKEQGHVE
ncbi:MAG: hypothetical protein ACTHJ1_03350 [Bordetella sp.]|uniref:hypothetical protein n=1 Tax=Bordetella sp. TaxID=28081 RepID=UPI003F7C688C